MRLNRLLLFALSAPALFAQSHWVAMPAPPGALDQSKILRGFGIEEKLIHYRDGDFLATFSTVTGTWATHRPTFGTSPIVRPEFIIIPESDRYTALGAYRGVFEPLPVPMSSTTLLLPGSALQSSVFCVRHGDTAYAFSSFTGRFHSHPVPASWDVSLAERMVLAANDPYDTPFGGGTVFDAMTGQWFDLPAQGAERIAGSTNHGSAVLWRFRDFDDNEYCATWSAQRAGGWRIHSPLTRRNPAEERNGKDASFLASGKTTFSGIVSDPITSNFLDIDANGLVATAIDPMTGNHQFLSINGTTWFSGPDSATTALFGQRGFHATRGALQMVEAGDTTYAFSAVTGTLTSHPVAATYERRQFSETVGLLADASTNALHVYSALTGTWHAVPATVPVPVGRFDPYGAVGPVAAFWNTPSGVLAFSARTATFLTLPGTTPVGKIGAATATTLSMFDPRLDRWVSTPFDRANATFYLSDKGNSGLVIDSQQAVTFDQRAGRLDVLPLSEPVLAASELEDGGAFVLTANALHANSSQPDIKSWFGFPDDKSVAGTGTTLRYQARLASNEVIAVFLSPLPTTGISLPGLGELLLNPTLTLTAGVAAGISGEHRAVFEASIPNDPRLRNTEWSLQGFMLSSKGSAHLTDMAAVRIL